MAKSHEILTLIDAHFRGDHEKFKNTVLVIAANSENSSPRLARDLRRMAERQPQASRFIELPQQVTGMLTNLSLTVGLDDLIVDDSTRARIDRVLLEQRKRETLFAAGFSPMRRLLFVGPPGVGKIVPPVLARLSTVLRTAALDAFEQVSERAPQHRELGWRACQET